MVVAPLQRLLSSAQLARPPHLRSLIYTPLINWSIGSQKILETIILGPVEMALMAIYRFDSMVVAPLERLLRTAQSARPHLRSVTFTSIIDWLSLQLM